MLGAGTRDPTIREIERLRPYAVDDEAFKRALKRASAEFWAEQVRSSPTIQTQLDLDHP